MNYLNPIPRGENTNKNRPSRQPQPAGRPGPGRWRAVDRSVAAVAAAGGQPPQASPTSAHRSLSSFLSSPFTVLQFTRAACSDPSGSEQRVQGRKRAAARLDTHVSCSCVLVRLRSVISEVDTFAEHRPIGAAAGRQPSAVAARRKHYSLVYQMMYSG